MARKKKANEQKEIVYAPIIPQPITETIEKNYMPYTMSVIVSRAIPEIDGFKPAHRKILYTMYKMGLLTGRLTKSTNIVGSVMKLHPHGDQSIYETMVRLTRGNETLLHPFIESKGTFGKQYSSDMKCAAARYTEAKLDPISAEIFDGIDKNAVDMVDNYDGSMLEPVLSVNERLSKSKSARMRLANPPAYKPKKEKKKTNNLPYGYEKVEQIVHKSSANKKLEKPKFTSIEDRIAKQKEEDAKKPKIVLGLLIGLGALVIVGGILIAVFAGKAGYFDGYAKDGYTVSITFDSNGGTFKGSDSSVIDLYNPDKVGEDGIKLLAPDDSRRDKNNALTVTKAGYFLAGWYTERTPIDPANPDAGYTYSGRWNFESDRVKLDPEKTYTPEESALTLYAAWVPYYNYEIYAKNESGETVLISTASALKLTIPEWTEGAVSLEMDNFPSRDGYTLDKVTYLDGSELDIKPNENGTKFIEGDWDKATATSLTPTIKLLTTWVEGERYRIYSTEDLRKSADPNGYYEIYADLDFSNVEWPQAFANGKFNGQIFGNGHKIIGATIESTSRSRISNGLFSSLGENAHIENLEFVDITHKVNIISVAPGTTFGLIAGSAADSASFDNVKVSGKILIGDDCASLADSADYTMHKLFVGGSTKGIEENILVEKANPATKTFSIKVDDDGTVSITKGD